MSLAIPLLPWKEDDHWTGQERKNVKNVKNAKEVTAKGLHSTVWG